MDAKLSDNDIAVFGEVADWMIDGGIWRSYRRAPGNGCDFFEITDAAADGPVFSVGLCGNARYAVVFHRDNGIRFGRTLAEALAHVAFVPSSTDAA